jgi:hypothetical protein
LYAYFSCEECVKRFSSGAPQRFAIRIKTAQIAASCQRPRHAHPK